jgi:DNA-directed RNA polymerase specialized sigma24 family protein
MTESTRRFPWRQAGETSAADLLRECGEKLTNRVLWTKFQDSFQGLIFLYLLRSLHFRGILDDAEGIVPDLAQEVYLRLVQHDGRILRTFRGTTEYSVMAFLARISATVVRDYQRQGGANKRGGQVIPIDRSRVAEREDRGLSETADYDSGRFNSILAWVDVQRVVDSDSDRKNAARNALIFKLHYVDGFTAAEIARSPGFELTKAGVETILNRLRKRIQG